MPSYFVASASALFSLFSAFAFYRVVFRWEGAKEALQKQGRSISRPAMLALTLSAMLMSGAFALHSLGEARRADPAKISDVDAARAFIVGTWAYTEPIRADAQYLWSWQKWEVRSDGTVLVFDAKPTDNDWGQPQAMKYTIFTDKYSDTGERFFGFRFEGTAVGAIIARDGSLLYTNTSNIVGKFRRGDVSPFSR